MAPAEPLFTNNRRDSSIRSQERATDEDTALLGGQRKEFGSRLSRASFWRELGLFIWALVATAAVIFLAVLIQHQNLSHGSNGKTPPKYKGKRNLIFMVSDGMGPASLSMTRSFRQFRDGLPIDDILVLDQHFIGSSRTRSSSSLVTDSAAGATAFSCGMKSYNGAISMLPDHTPCGTVLEAAKKAGYMTGLVVTTDITDATPACFASHVNIRLEEDLIAQQEIGEHPLGRVVDLMLGGGRCHFLPNTSEGGCRADDRDLTKVAQEKFGWKYIDNREDFDKLKLGKSVQLPLMGLFAERDIPFEIDRRHQNDIYPSLNEMAKTALKALEDATVDSEKGFFLMIEGSRIDHAGHGNDPAAQVNEVLAYDSAFASVIEFLERSNDDGVLVATSDHETGGLSVARQLNPIYPEYKWFPEVLANVSSSAEHSAGRLNSHLAQNGNGDSLRKFISKELVLKGLGITDLTEVELQLLVDNPLLSVYTFADMISRRAQIGWSTHGHSATDVNIYGTSGSESLGGNHENIEIGKFLRDYLEVDVKAVTDELVGTLDTFAVSGNARHSWKGRKPSEEELELALNHYQPHYG
ncbi:probable repressible alkaline phosphatase [Rhynchosporium secalis]|uniref:Alkaline phosphatase n=1 Tax=Rhynchosporium secalis TaxID=38038 RepID=A0A1E1LUX0_RHYSE|nr:probable repressible alkaline phosphatase [Rhynchosporium secalis]